MRRSFGSGGGNMGGGGGMIRNVQRAIRAGVGGAPPEPFSSSTATASATRKAKSLQPTSPTTSLAISSSASANNTKNGTSAFSSLINLPLSSSSSISYSDESDWECVDSIEDGRARVFYEDYVFGTVPSADEVHHAVSALQQAISPASKGKHSYTDVADEEVGSPIYYENQINSGMDWVEPSPHLSKMLELHGSDRSVYDAFHLLETEPSVQRMVVSLSSDKAVWDAVLNNEVVKELRGSIYPKGDSLIEESSDSDGDESNPVKDILSWIVVKGKAKIMQLIDNIMKLVNGAFGPPNEAKKEDSADPFQEKLKTSLLLSIVVLFIVVITRTKSA